MTVRLAFVFCLAFPFSVSSDTISTFTISNITNQILAGVFDDGTTNSGSFAADLSQPLQSFTSLTSWDFWTTDSPALTLKPFYPGPGGTGAALFIREPRRNSLAICIVPS